VQVEDKPSPRTREGADLVRELLTSFARMRSISALRATLCACACAALVTPSPAWADARRTLAPVALHKKPGEHEPVVARLPAGAEVAVIAVEGRWLRVRAGSVEGYLTRTTVSDDPAAPTAAPPARRWSGSKPSAGQGGAPRVSSDAAPSIAAGTLSGASGSVSGTSSSVSGASGSVSGASGAASVRPVAGRLAGRAELGLGYRALGMDLTSNADGGLTNYALDAGAIAATLELDAVLRLGGAVVAAADARLAATDSSPGVDYPGPSAPPGQIPFRTLALDAGARIGARIRGGFDLALRGGVHYDAFVTRRVDNAGLLPRERLLGATLGARVDIAPERSPFAITARFDALIAGARQQTDGLEDGMASTAHALWGGLTMRYAIGRHLAVFGGYEFGRATTAWSGRSARQPGATTTRRVDTAQLVEIGIGTQL
jgi:hypothetical protein